MKNKETLEELALRLYPENWESIMEGQHDSNSYERNAFINGYKLAQQQMYSEEEVKEILYKHTEDLLAGKKVTLEEWFEQFKKK